ncbi:MAG: DUF4115 domain-containing protein [Deltaproteobacteria bacterium]|nr:DUF4115 domain-containing protein [Deltaproteobacteria bacterium]MDH4122004.1 DUF4115 domain-containing protein [Deltaproteobacteria bacterium]
MANQAQRVKEVCQSIGARLKAGREAKGLSLNDIAANTRINQNFLKKIEVGDHNGLPAPAFVRGFIRNYARVVGISPDDLLYDYARLLRLTDTEEEENLSPPQELKQPGFTLTMPPAQMVALGLAGLALVWGVIYLFSPKANTPEPVASSQTEPQTAPTPSPAMSGKALVLSVKGVEATWLRITPDKGTPLDVLVGAGQTKEYGADREFHLTIGRAGGITATLNGQPVRLPTRNDQLVPDLLLNRQSVGR